MQNLRVAIVGLALAVSVTAGGASCRPSPPTRPAPPSARRTGAAASFLVVPLGCARVAGREGGWPRQLVRERRGVRAEVLKSALGYPAAVGIDVSWLVIDESEAFVELTKRIHHLLQGGRGDGGPPGDEQCALYKETLGREAKVLSEYVRPGDVLVLHDPQVLGLARCVGSLGAIAICRCRNREPQGRRAWDFLLPCVGDTAAQTFTRRQYRRQPDLDAQLAGPSAESVDDDPEGTRSLATW